MSIIGSDEEQELKEMSDLKESMFHNVLNKLEKLMSTHYNI